MLLPIVTGGHDGQVFRPVPGLFVLKTRRVCESLKQLPPPLLQTFVAKMSFLVRRKKKHGGICKGVLKVGSGEAQKGLDSEAQKNAHRHCEAQFREDFRLQIWRVLALAWEVLGGGCGRNLTKICHCESCEGPVTTLEEVHVHPDT